MTIKNRSYYIGQLWDWGFLDECFRPTKIKVTDIDGFVERNGKFLLIETKSNDAKIPTGQQIMFDNMIKTSLFTVFIIWGNANQPEKGRLFTRKKTIEYPTLNEVKIIQIVKAWFKYANN
jgi:hypothetical protein